MIDSFTADQYRLERVPATVRLAWCVRDAACVVLSGHGRVDGGGMSVEVAVTTTFALTAHGAGPAAVDERSLTIEAPEVVRPPEVPVGAIAAWHGDPRRIPTGWRLCDGTGNTPDLRGRYVLGAGAGAEPEGPGDTHTHAVTLTVTGRTGEYGAHEHGLPERWHPGPAARPGVFARMLNKRQAGLRWHGEVRVTGRAAHSHGIEFERTLRGELSPAGPPAPPTYALCYIMRAEPA
jgi:hypothetical protein